LNTLGLTIQQLPLMYDLGKINREFLNQCVSSSMEVIQHISRTIDDFRNYFRPDKEKIEFNVHDSIMNAMSLLKGTLQNTQIDIAIVAKDDPVIYGYQNEFSQVLLNILMNARDALLERNIDDPRVTITICSEDGCAVVTISDSAGGISEDIIDKIFDPYFTTKGPQQGTEVGLFMSKTIIEKNMGGRLSVRNNAAGAEFRIEVGHENTM
jgi:signal transduction histidine kinase